MRVITVGNADRFEHPSDCGAVDKQDGLRDASSRMVSFAVATQTVHEAIAASPSHVVRAQNHVRVDLSEPAPETVSVVWAIFPSSNLATIGEDYTDQSGTLNIPAGQRFGYIDLGIVDDDAVEGDEVVPLTLNSVRGGGAVIDSSANRTVVTIDSDDKLTATWSAPARYNPDFDADPDLFEFETEVVFNHPLTFNEARNLRHAVHAFFSESHTRYSQNQWGGELPVMVDDGDTDSFRSTTWKVRKTREQAKPTIPVDTGDGSEGDTVAVRLLPTFNNGCTSRPSAICANIGGKLVPLWGSPGPSGRTHNVEPSLSAQMRSRLGIDTTIEVSVASKTVNEDAGTVAITFTVRNSAAASLTVVLNASGSATETDDYILPDDLSFTIPPSSSTSSVLNYRI